MRILVVTGSSGGHIFPAISFLEALKDRHKDVDALLVLPRKSFADNNIADNYKLHYISISNIKLSFDFRNIFAILKFLKGSWAALILILNYQPDMVVGFGSLVSVPLILSAWLFRITTVIHEQNVIPGRANRLLARFSTRIAVSFEETKHYFRGSLKKIVVTGNPIRKGLNSVERNKALDFFKLSPDKFTILLIGGSRGSHSINIGFLNAISTVVDKSKLQVIHLAGDKDRDLLSDGYKKLEINFRVFGFLNEMQYAYSACDFVICRAGATTITEIIFFKLPAIIIPYPFAYGHQVSNARILADNGCAILIKDNELGSPLLKQAIENLIDNPDKIRDMRSGYRSIPRSNGNELLVNEVMSLH